MGGKKRLIFETSVSHWSCSPTHWTAPFHLPREEETSKERGRDLLKEAQSRSLLRRNLALLKGFLALPLDGGVGGANSS